MTEVGKSGDMRGVNQNKVFMKKTHGNLRSCNPRNKYSKGIEWWYERMGGAGILGAYKGMATRNRGKDHKGGMIKQC